MILPCPGLAPAFFAFSFVAAVEVGIDDVGLSLLDAGVGSSSEKDSQAASSLVTGKCVSKCTLWLRLGG